MTRGIGLAVLVSVSWVGLAEAADPPALIRAHALYNDGDFEGAIQAVSGLERQPATGDAAALLVGRARL
jgi:hypothetical protein